MKTFDEIKSLGLKRGADAGASCSQWKRFKSATTIDEILGVVKDNIVWMVANKVVDRKQLKSLFGLKKLKEHNIYVEGEHDVTVREGIIRLALLDSSSANVETWDSSSANVETWVAHLPTWRPVIAHLPTWRPGIAHLPTWRPGIAHRN